MNALESQLCPWLTAELTRLESAFTAGRLGHGWILAGPRGTGKLNLALVLADRMLRGETGMPLPPAIEPGSLVTALDERYQPRDRHPDLHIVWPEEGKRSIGVDSIRSIIDSISLTGYAGELKVVVIEPAEAMTIQAANALLKSLEEPAPGTQLFLISHCPGRLPATIRSRCQTLALSRPRPHVLDDWLGRDERPQDNPLFDSESAGPVDIARRLSFDNINKYNNIDNILNSLSEGRLGPGDALDSCRGLDMALVLEWIAGRLGSEIRGRARAGVSNSITDAHSDLTENPWRRLGLMTLLGLLADIQKLRRQLDSGLNEQLALEVVFSEMTPA